MFLEEYEKTIEEIVNTENILCLKTSDFGDKNVLEFKSLIEKTRSAINDDGIFDFIIMDIIDTISPAIKFSLANLYLYQPYTNQLNKEIHNNKGELIPTYHKKMGEERYLYYLNVTFEKLYNFWDRIGDLLNLCFNLGIPNNRVYFSLAMDKLDELNLKSTHFYKLKVFKNADYSDYLNRIRKTIVHHRQKETYFTMQVLDSLGKDDVEDRIQELQREKDGYPDILKGQIQQTIDGFSGVINLIKEFGPFEN